MILFAIFINLTMVLPFALDSPHVLYIVLRFFGGTCVTLVNHIHKAFTLYDDLNDKELKNIRDSEILYFMRIFFMWFCCGFTIYLCASCCCLCCVAGIDGNNI